MDITDEKSNHMTNGRAKNGSSVHLLDAPVIVNTADLERTGATLNTKRDAISISLVQPSASANADISKHSKMNSPSHQRSYQRANVADAISSSLNVSTSQLHKHTLATAALADGEDITEIGLEMEEIPLQLRNVPSQQPTATTSTTTLPPPYSPS